MQAAPKTSPVPPILRPIALTFSALLALGSGTASAEPAWCKVDGVNFEYPDIDRALEREIDPVFILPQLIDASCETKHPQRKLKEVEQARAYWSKRLDMTEADWADAVAWRGMDLSTRNAPSLASDKDKLARSTYSPIEQYLRTEDEYSVDALDSRLSELGRLAYITRCLRKKTAAEWAVCQPDIDRLDRKKLVTELRADKSYGGYVKMVIRLKLDNLDAQLKEHAAAVHALFAKDPGYTKIFEIAANARKDWERVDTRLTDLVLQMEDARDTNSRKAFTGCSDRVRPVFKDIVSKIPAKRFEKVKSEPGAASVVDDVVRVIMSDPAGYLASIALLMCETEQDHLIASIDNAVQRWPGFRGPRLMAMTQILEAGIEFDDRDTKLEVPETRHVLAAHSTTKPDKSPGHGYGRKSIRNVKKVGDTTHIDFVRESGTQTECTAFRESNRIVAIEPGGRIVYDATCLAEKTEVVDLTWEPLEVDNRYAEGLKAGMIIESVGDVIGAAWAKRDSKAPTFVLGVPVK